MKVTWSEPALAHLVAIQDYLSQQASPYTAEQFLLRLMANTEQLASFPRIGRVVPDPEDELRELVFRPYRIVYQVEAERVVVVAVIHGSRDFSVALAQSLEELASSEDRESPEPS